MIVSKLIEILKKCDPNAETHFCYGDNERVDVVEFVEFNVSGNNVFFYEDEPSWNNDSSLDDRLELDTITLISDDFIKSTYKVAK